MFVHPSFHSANQPYNPRLLPRVVGLLYILFAVIINLMFLLSAQPSFIAVLPILGEIVVQIIIGITLLWRTRNVALTTQSQADAQGTLIIDAQPLVRQASLWLLGLALLEGLAGIYTIFFIGNTLGILYLIVAGIFALMGFIFLAASIWGEKTVTFPPTTTALATRVATLEAEIKRLKQEQ